MKVHHLWLSAITLTATTTTAIATPKHFSHEVQGILGDIKDQLRFNDWDTPLFNHDDDNRNPLDAALSSIDTPTTVTDEIDSDDIANQDPSTWTRNFLEHPIDDLKNPPKELSDLTTDIIYPPHHPRTSNKTIYQLITESKYTTILSKIIQEDQELIDYLNSTDSGNITFFAPTDHAFSKIPHRRHHDHDHDHDHKDKDHDGDDDEPHHGRPSKEFIRSLLKYHSSPDIHTAAQIFHAHTLPSGLKDDLLGEDLPQRLTVRAGLKGLVLNFYSRIVAVDIGASNGLIHALDSILLPPPKSPLLLDIVPTHFSTFNLALYKTNLTSSSSFISNSTAKHGLTIFVPSNSAFQRLGLRLNAFLFSPSGTKYLRALLQYHIVPDRTLYSDVLYTHDGHIRPFGVKGFTHLDLPTLLDGRKVAVDVVRFGPYASFKLNGYHRVSFADVLARDGNLHVLDRVLIPPRRVGDGVVPGDEEGGELTVEDLKARLMGWVVDEDFKEEDLEEEVVQRADL